MDLDLRCEVEACGRKVMAYRMCAMHYARVRKHGSTDLPAPSLEYKARYARWENLKKRYVVSGWATFSEFDKCVGTPPTMKHSIYPAEVDKPLGPNNYVWALRKGHKNNKPRIFNTHTKEGKAAYDKHLREKDPSRERRYAVLRNHGITLEQYNDMLVAQKACCAICEEPEVFVKQGRLMPLNVDHDHATGAIRGLLCMKCNRGLGLMRDDPRILANAITYLAEAAEKTTKDNIVVFNKKEA